MKVSRSAALLVVAIVIAAATAVLLARRPATSPVAEATSGPLLRTLRFSARIAAQSRVEAGSTVTGRVAKVHVREGDEVQAGQLLVSLDAEEARAALGQARASERQSQTRITALDRTSLGVARAQMRQAEATLANAEAELRRGEELARDGYISVSRVDDNRRGVQVALAQRDAFRAQLDAVDAQGVDRAQAHAQWEAARAATAAAAARLAQTEIRAPAAARVLARMAEPGQIVQAGKPLVGLALRGPVHIVAQVDERFLEQLRTGQAAAAIPDAHPGERLQASVLSISPLVDAQKGAVEVKLSLKGAPAGLLREDMTVSVEVVTGERSRALVVPAGAVRRDGNGSEHVLLLVDGRARSRVVRVGLRTTDAVEVLDGLAERDKVLLDPTLEDGQAVRAAAGGRP